MPFSTRSNVPSEAEGKGGTVQFYLNGYKPGDPDLLVEAAASGKRSGELPDAVDVLIVGSGPAGTVLAAQLSMFPSINTRIAQPSCSIGSHKVRSGLGLGRQSHKVRSGRGPLARFLAGRHRAAE